MILLFLYPTNNLGKFENWKKHKHWNKIKDNLNKNKDEREKWVFNHQFEYIYIYIYIYQFKHILKYMHICVSHIIISWNDPLLDNIK